MTKVSSASCCQCEQPSRDHAASYSGAGKHIRLEESPVHEIMSNFREQIQKLLFRPPTIQQYQVSQTVFPTKSSEYKLGFRKSMGASQVFTYSGLALPHPPAPSLTSPSADMGNPLGVWKKQLAKGP